MRFTSLSLSFVAVMDGTVQPNWLPLLACFLIPITELSVGSRYGRGNSLQYTTVGIYTDEKEKKNPLVSLIWKLLVSLIWK
jgi:hypothetical protein